MSKKVLILGVAVVLAVGGVATYLWVDYSQAQNSLTRSRLDVRDLAENIERHPEDVARLKEMYDSAKLEVDLLERYHSSWIDKEEISALRTALEKDKHDIDRLAGMPTSEVMTVLLPLGAAQFLPQAWMPSRRFSPMRPASIPATPRRGFLPGGPSAGREPRGA